MQTKFLQIKRAIEADVNVKPALIHINLQFVKPEM